MAERPEIYHRLESPTQTAEHARLQEVSGELWGRAPRGSNIPAAQAYIGPLPAGRRGIEFSTTVQPDPNKPPGQAFWTGPRTGVKIEGDFATIKIKILRNTQTT